MTEQVQLAEQINMLDLKDINRMFSQANVKKNSDCSVEPVGEDMIGRSDSPVEQVDSWREAGLEALGQGEVGVILLAGGQGTRLGSDRPKALYDVGLPSKKTLIELQAERIRKLEYLANGRIIPWYVMASPATVGQVREAFESSSNFGMEEDQVKIFLSRNSPLSL